MKSRILLLLLLPLVTTGCATYRQLPLDNKVTLAPSVSHLTVDTEGLPFRDLRSHRFDVADGLDMTEVAMLAVANNPALKLARDDEKIAYAQAFAAGLLPDPQVSLSRDFPVQGTPGAVNAYSAGLGFELSSLVSHAASQSASRFQKNKTDLDLLWQEWQVVAQARLLFSRSIAQEQLLRWLTDDRDLLADRYKKAKVALDEGNLTRDGSNTALIAWQDASRHVSDLERQKLQTHNDLNALLGLSPEVSLNLVPDQELKLPDEEEIDLMLDTLPDRRPDLLALKAGYAAQDARYRQAILDQFPAFNLAFTVASDTSGVPTHGFSLSLALPFLNGNRGNVAIQDATRQRLHDEYQIRLNAAYMDVKRLLDDSQLIASQLQSAEDGMNMMDKTADNAGHALADGLMDGSMYALFQSARIAKHVEVTNLKQSLLEDRIALLTLLGGDADKQAAPVEKSR
jgi:outer membrane protein TolC